jgi:hypothetical protein
MQNVDAACQYMVQGCTNDVCMQSLRWAFAEPMINGGVAGIER